MRILKALGAKTGQARGKPDVSNRFNHRLGGAYDTAPVHPGRYPGAYGHYEGEPERAVKKKLRMKNKLNLSQTPGGDT